MADELNDSPSLDTAGAPIEGAAPAEQNTPQEPAYTETEIRAMEQGWVPEDQWTGSGRWRSAEDFLDRGELFGKIDEVKRRAERAERVLEDLKKHHKQVREVEFKRALAILKNEKKEALDVGDSARVVELDDEIAETKAAAARAAFEQNQQHEDEPNPKLVAWINRNTWYNENKAMKAFADQVAAEQVQAGVRDPEAILREIEKQTKVEFAHKFVNPNRAKPGAVEAGGRPASTGKKDDFQLTPEETQVMRRFTGGSNPVMTKEEYIAEIKAMRGKA